MPIFIDQHKVADIGNQCAGGPDEVNRVIDAEEVDEADGFAEEAYPPEGGTKHACFVFFSIPPLDPKAAIEEG